MMVQLYRLNHHLILFHPRMRKVSTRHGIHALRKSKIG